MKKNNLSQRHLKKQSKDRQACIWSDIKTSRHRSPGEETKSHCDLEHRGGFYSNSRHLTYALLLLVKSEIGKRRPVLRKERLEKMKIRRGRGEEKGRWGKGRKEEADQDNGERRRAVGDEQGKIDVGEWLEIIS